MRPPIYNFHETSVFIEFNKEDLVQSSFDGY